MDIAALIFAPLLLALIYNWTGMNRLPRVVRVGLPVGLLIVIFVALVGYGPAVQEAIATRTSLVRDFAGRIFPLYLDGLSLVFGLLITGLGAVIALCASAIFADGDMYRRFAQAVLIYVGLALALVLTDSIDLLPHFLTFLFLPLLFLLIRFSAPTAVSAPGEQRPWPRWQQSLFTLALYVAFFLPYGLIRLGITFLTELGGAATPTIGGSSGLALFSGYNLSHKMSYEAFFLLILAPLLFYVVIVCIVWQWRSARNLPAAAHAFLPAGTMMSLSYLLTRFYPAVHDNPLWWDIVTGVGLLIMLIGAVWSLRQRGVQAILITSTLSRLGAVVALLGLPEFLGYKAALIGIVVQVLSGAALFLSLDVTRKKVRWVIQGLALLPLVIFHGLMIAAFAQVTLAWTGIALAVVMVSTALWLCGMMRVVRAGTDAQQADDQQGALVRAQHAAPLQEVIPGVLSLASLAFVGLFEPAIGPLLNPIAIKQPLMPDTSMPLILGIFTIVGGVILYATRDAWGRFIQIKPAAENRQSA